MSSKSAPFNLVCWKWNAGIHPKKKIRFTAEHVNRLYSMLKRNIQHPFKLHCITDDSHGIREEVNIIPLWDDYAQMGGCYRRLRLFAKEMETLIGPDFFSIDLDVVIIRDITQLLSNARQFEFKMWADTNPTTPYNGSFIYMKAGKRSQVWQEFDPVESPKKAKLKRYVGTDQAWIGACLGPNEAKWGTRDGIFSYRVHFLEGRRPHLKGDEKIVFFHGASDPSKEDTQKLSPWIKDYWQ